MRGTPSNRALRMRRHREEMEVALVHGLSIDAARERLKTYRAHLPRLTAPIDGLGGAPAAPPERLVQWWQREDL